MVIAAGAARFNLLKFIIADGLAALVSGGLFMFIGHWFGKNFGSLDQLHQARKKVAGVEHWVFLGIIALILLLATWIWWRRRTHTTPSIQILEKAATRIEHQQSSKL
jgi:membrane protein DedA with SNARE-associated domain